MTRDECIAQLDPELAVFIDNPAIDPAVIPLEMMRAGAEANFRSFSGPLDNPPHCARVAGRPGQPDVEVRVHRPSQGAPQLGILHIHGGGMVMGSAASLDGAVAKNAEKFQAIVASVEYRLAPETPFPGPLMDCLAGWDWLVANADALGLAGKPVIVMGESAGGGLAAALCLYLRDSKDRLPDGQILVYPMLDHRTGRGDEVADTRIGWNAALNQFGWNALQGPAAPEGPALGYFSPARADNLAGLPPAYIPVGSLDLFLGENIDYARRIAEAGGEVRLITYPGAPHGFQIVPSNVGRRFNQDLAAAIARFVDDKRPNP